ncbi:MAG: 3-deoxy-D-manno-octulosonic acid transferase [Chitinophagia bacterium]|nr:3-deoxy-D-manno-octulosonic acid transferase [Chitinophagia bacterium]
MVFAYNIFIILYGFGIKIASLFNRKARLWVKGRVGWKKELTLKLNGNKSKIIWMHSASLGEFEQGRTLIESIRKHYSSYKILITFFSPSGYEVRKNYAGVDYVFYLPLDTKKNAEQFIELIQPSLVVFIKYELWYHYLHTLHKKRIPTILISAIILPSQAYFGVFGKFFLDMLRFFTHVFVQGENSKALLRSLNVKTHITVSGDTRFDRVVEISNEIFHHKSIEHFCNEQQIFIAGSTWKEDEEALALLQSNQMNLKFIIAPHEINSSHINHLKTIFKNAICLSDYTIDDNADVLIIDSIGMLSKIYRYATLAYVGGGFNKAGIHNVLEAAVYGKVVFWGPHFNRSAEASKLIEAGAGYSFEKNADFIKQATYLLENHSERERLNMLAKEFVQTNMGATSRIMVFLQDSKIL